MNEEIIHNTIAKMREAGLTDAVIGSTLSDLGLNAGQVQAFLGGNSSPSSNATSSPPAGSAYRPSPAYASPASAPPVPQSSFSITRPAREPAPPVSRDIDHEVLASRTSEKVMQRMDERDALSNEESDLKDSISHLALEQHGEQLQSTHQSVMDLHEKFDATNLDTISNRVSAISGKVDALARDAMETKALLKAVQMLMQKILETNQQLIFESKNRK